MEDTLSKVILFTIGGIILSLIRLFYIDKRLFNNIKQGNIRNVFKLIKYTSDFSTLLFFIFFFIIALVFKYYSIDIQDDPGGPDDSDGPDGSIQSGK